MTYPKPSKASFHVSEQDYNLLDEWTDTLEESLALAHTIENREPFVTVKIYKHTVWNSEDGIWEDGGDICYNTTEGGRRFGA